MSLRRLSNADEILGEQTRRCLLVAQFDALDLAGHDGAASRFDVCRAPFAHVEPEQHNHDLVCFVAVRYCFRKAVARALASSFARSEYRCWTMAASTSTFREEVG